jgi:DNA polymerase III epsilon subunit-like protein
MNYFFRRLFNVKNTRVKNKIITSMEKLKAAGVNPPFIFTVFDTETNGLNARDAVLSVSAEKWFFDGISYTQIGVFERFYFPKWFLNKQAVAVNGLTRKELRLRRKGKDWPKLWYKDIRSFASFIGNDTDVIVGHNVNYDRKYYRFMDNRKLFCTMFSNIKKVNRRNANNKLIVPKLIGTAEAYGITVEEEKLHYSYYDVHLTVEVFKKMIDETFVPVF